VRIGLLLLGLAATLGCDQDRRLATSCASNLRMLYTLQQTYAIQFGGPERKPSATTGSQLWLELALTKPPLIETSELDLFVCPFTGKPAAPGFTTYRGPTKPVSELAGGDIVGCCDHGGRAGGRINVLRKNGDVMEVDPTDPLHARALAGTK
jgi:hypothetical protein